MSAIFSTIRSLLVFALVLTSLNFAATEKAQAYELDTHFYLTYILSRHVGFNHDVAVHFALAAQWIDESKKTSPMSALPIRGAAMRRHFHFHDYRQAAETAAHGPVGISSITESTVNHALGSNALFIGMTEGNWLQAAASIHMIQDTYGHAGYTAELGHMEGGHNPDRPELALPKYKVMIDRVIHALWAMRHLMPVEALDKDIATKEFLAKDPTELLDDFLYNSGYMDVVLGSGLRDRHYVHFAFSELLNMLKKSGYIYDHVDVEKLVPDVEAFSAEDKFTHTAMTDMLFPVVAKQIMTLRENYDYEDSRSSVDFAPMEAELIEKDPSSVVFNFEKLREDVIPGQPIGWASIEEIAINLAKDYALEAGAGTGFESKDFSEEEERMLNIKNLSREEQMVAGIKLLLFRAVTRIARSHVPRPFSSTHHVEFEREGTIRQFEKALRTAYIQKYLKDTYGKEIEFNAAHKPSWTSSLLAATKLSLKKLFRMDTSEEEEAMIMDETPIDIVTMPRPLRRQFDREVGGLVNYKTIIQDLLGKTDEVDEKVLAYQIPDLFLHLHKEGHFQPLATAAEVERMMNGDHNCHIVLTANESNSRRSARKAAGLE